MDISAIFSTMQAEISLAIILIVVLLADLILKQPNHKALQGLSCGLLVVQIALNIVPVTGEAFGGMSIQDTARHVTLEGEYGFYDERTDYAFATDSARFLEYSQGDTLFLHADTLRMVTIDSTYREIKAYYGVRFYRTDLQGVCDSMQFNTRDSVLYMFTEPIVWNEQYQIFGDTILIEPLSALAASVFCFNYSIALTCDCIDCHSRN